MHTLLNLAEECLVISGTFMASLKETKKDQTTLYHFLIDHSFPKPHHTLQQIYSASHTYPIGVYFYN